MLKSLEILCVEDNPGDMRMIREMFNDDRSRQYTITFADQLEKVKKIFIENIFDAILLDLSLPDSFGLDTLKSVKQLFPKTPIIVLSGIQDEKVTEKTIQFGAQDYLFKNQISTELLTHSIHYAIDREAFSKKIIETQQQFKALIEKNSDGILVIDKVGIIRFLNPSCEVLLDSTPSELLGKPFDFPYSINENTEISFEVKSGAIKTVEIRVSDVVWEDEPCYLLSLRDITIRKELETKNMEVSKRLMELNENKDKFFSIIAHDLKSPFQALINLTEIMADAQETFSISEYKIFSQSINKSASNVSLLLGNLLEWAQIQRNSINFNPEHIQLLPLLEKSIEISSMKAIQKEIKIINEVEKNHSVFADVEMVDTILRNLISNALKFTNRGGVITITSEKIENNSVELSVNDTGIGISEERINKLFLIDEKIGTKGTEDEPTSGLGLILCKEFAEKNGGNIRVRSIEGKGSQFIFNLPLSGNQ